jgi:hypothetical protein
MTSSIKKKITRCATTSGNVLFSKINRSFEIWRSIIQGVRVVETITAPVTAINNHCTVKHKFSLRRVRCDRIRIHVHVETDVFYPSTDNGRSAFPRGKPVDSHGNNQFDEGAKKAFAILWQNLKIFHWRRSYTNFSNIFLIFCNKSVFPLAIKYIIKCNIKIFKYYKKNIFNFNKSYLLIPIHGYTYILFERLQC